MATLQAETDVHFMMSARGRKQEDKMKLYYLKYLWIPFIISAVIFYLCCLISPSQVPDVGFDFFIPADKMVHFLMYFGLSGATGLYYVYDKRGNVNITKLLVGAILIPIVYGGFIELVQWKFFAPRSGDWGDFLADVLGSLSTLPLIFYYRKHLLRKNIYSS